MAKAAKPWAKAWKQATKENIERKHSKAKMAKYRKKIAEKQIYQRRLRFRVTP